VDRKNIQLESVLTDSVYMISFICLEKSGNFFSLESRNPVKILYFFVDTVYSPLRPKLSCQFVDYMYVYIIVNNLF